jgi:glucuronate isomerase
MRRPCGGPSARCFDHFKSRGARACAISLPPDFAPFEISAARANTALAAINAEGIFAPESHRRAIGNFVFWTLAEICAEYRLPFDLMIGVNRGVYESGVHQGRDLYDSRVSLIQYKELFNAFPQVLSDFGAGERDESGADELRLDLPERRDERALVV